MSQQLTFNTGVSTGGPGAACALEEASWHSRRQLPPIFTLPVYSVNVSSTRRQVPHYAGVGDRRGGVEAGASGAY